MPDTTINPAALATITLARGAHRGRDGELCMMEVVAWFAGEPHSDRPKCVSPVLGVYGRTLNDALPRADRQQLKPLIPLLPGTAGDGHDEARGYLALDWLIRTYAPAWLDLAGLSGEARALRALRPIVDPVSAKRAAPVVRAGRDKASAARAAARAAAWASAGVAASTATEVAAWDATEAAGGVAARAADWNAAGAAASTAAWAAARVAAWASAKGALALAPTAAALQQSAIDLFRTMINPEMPIGNAALGARGDDQ